MVQMLILQKYDSKLSILSAHEAAYRPNYHTIDGKISKMRASVDIAKRLFDYCQLQEISARAHLIEVTQIRSINSLIIPKETLCISRIQHIKFDQCSDFLR